MSDPPVPETPTRPPAWLWPNLVCLDAPVVAVVWLGAFAAAYGMEPGAAGFGILFLVVWGLYAGDRVLDVLKLRAGDRSPGLQTPRHAFTRRHFRWFAVLAVGAALIGGIAALTALERPVLGAGLIVATGALAYFGAFVAPLGGKRPLPGKEPAAGMLIAAGVTVPVFSDYAGSLPVLPAYALFAGACTLNLLLIASRDGDLPPGRAFDVLLTVLGLGLALTAGGFALWGTTTETAPALRPLYFSLALTGAALTILQRCRRSLSGDAFRVLADVALLTPLIPLP